MTEAGRPLGKQMAIPKTTVRAASRTVASVRQRSGPMPAGSPLVTAITGPVISLPGGFRVGPVAQLAQPVPGRRRRACVRAGLLGVEVLSFFGHVALAAFENLDEVHAEGRLDHRAEFVFLQGVHGLFEFGHGVAGLTTQVAPLAAEPSWE